MYKMFLKLSSDSEFHHQSVVNVYVYMPEIIEIFTFFLYFFQFLSSLGTNHTIRHVLGSWCRFAAISPEIMMFNIGHVIPFFKSVFYVDSYSEEKKTNF